MKRFSGLLMAIAVLGSGCGDGGGGSSPSGGTVIAPPVVTSQCSLRNRQDFALATLREWYLFPETLPANPDPTPFSSVGDYIDQLTAVARGQGRDRFFTYITSIAEEDAFFSSGSSAGFGIRLLSDEANRRTFIAEAFEGAPALAAGIDRGDELVAIGTTPATLRAVSDIIISEGVGGVSAALGDARPGTTRTIRVSNGAGVRDVTIAKTDYSLNPVSTRYGSKIIADHGRQVGYLNLRTFISTADPALRAAFAEFRTAGISDFVFDFRYNGGGLVSTAELIGDLLGANRSPSDVFSFTTFRPEKSAENSTRRFEPQSQSVAPVRVAFIGTGATASASELLINAFIPYLGSNMALIGDNTFGKPVGQIGIDRTACDDRIRVIAFSTRNAANSDAYFGGLASTVPTTCAAADDVSRPLGDPQEASTRAALDFLAGEACVPIASSTQQSRSARQAAPARMEMVVPAAPSAAQREVPGLF